MADLHRIRLFDYNPSPLVSVDVRGEELIAARENGYVEIWNIAKLAVCIGYFQASEEEKDISAIKWCKCNGNDSIAVSTLSGNLLIFDYPTLQLVTKSDSYGGAIYGMAVNQVKNRIAIACHDGCARLFSCEKGLELISSSTKTLTHLMCVCFGEDDMIYAGSTDNKIYTIHPVSGAFVQTFNIIKPQETRPITVWSLASLNEESIASGDSTGHLIVWNTKSATITEDFKSHQADILCVASRNGALYASGIDPSVACFEYDSAHYRWKQTGHRTLHSHDVTGLAIAEDNVVYSCSKDACIVSRNGKMIRPFQNKPPVASAMRDGKIVLVGAINDKILVYCLDGEKASLELQLTAKAPISCLAMSKDGLSFAYSADFTRIVTYSEGKWRFSPDLMPAAISVCFAPNGDLVYGTFDGDVYRGDKHCNVGYPVFKLDVSGRGGHIAIGVPNQIFIYDGELNQLVVDIPKLPGAFSAFAFQPGSSRFYVASGDDTVQCYHLGSRHYKNKQKIIFGKKLDVAPCMISFDPDQPCRMLIASSQKAIIKSTKNVNAPSIKLPFNDFLYVNFTGHTEIVVFEKPWQFIATNLSNPLRVKHFLQRDEAKYGRY